MSAPIKHDSGKTRFSLLPWDALREVAAVREYGVKTYGSEHSWQEVEPRRYVDALLRHGAEIVADGIHSRDAESGLLHSAHIACNALFLVWFAVRGQGSATLTVEQAALKLRLEATEQMLDEEEGLRKTYGAKRQALEAEVADLKLRHREAQQVFEDEQGKAKRLYDTYLETLEAREALAEELAGYKDPKPTGVILSPEKFQVYGLGVGRWFIRQMETGRVLKVPAEGTFYSWVYGDEFATPFTTRASAEAFMQGGAK